MQIIALHTHGKSVEICNIRCISPQSPLYLANETSSNNKKKYIIIYFKLELFDVMCVLLQQQQPRRQQQALSLIHGIHSRWLFGIH